MNCLDIRTLATEYLEAALPPKDHSASERHLKTCDRCEEWFETLEETIGAFGQLSNDELSPEREAELLEILMESKQTRPKIVRDLEKDDDLLKLRRASHHTCFTCKLGDKNSMNRTRAVRWETRARRTR